MKKYIVEVTRVCLNSQSRTIEVDAGSVDDAKAQADAYVAVDDDFWDGVREDVVDNEQPQFNVTEAA